jgi:hypothetical protein
VVERVAKVRTARVFVVLIVKRAISDFGRGISIVRRIHFGTPRAKNDSHHNDDEYEVG